jgi:hypothetical protein
MYFLQFFKTHIRPLHSGNFSRPLHAFPFSDVFLASPATHTRIPIKCVGMPRWRESPFALLLKNGNSNLKYFKLPLNRVIELVSQVEM